MGLIYKNHLARKEKLEKLIINGVKPKIVELWECEFTKLKTENGSELNQFLRRI